MDLSPENSSYLRLWHSTGQLCGRIELPGSKSESNRLLILSAIYPDTLKIKGLSTADDTQLLQQILTSKQSLGSVHCRMAGTAYRFLTAYYAATPGAHVLLTGSDRMFERPIGPLVDALRQLGADIQYVGKEGFPPLEIKGTQLTGGLVTVDGSTSSQFITALMLIGCSLPLGLKIHIQGYPVSVPYIYLTASTLWQVGLKVDVRLPEIHLYPSSPKKSVVRVEPDWSAASYWYLMALLSQRAEIYLPGLRIPSMQGDSVVRGYFDALGVETVFLGSGIRIFKKTQSQNQSLQLDLRDTPDIAQTLAVALAAIGQSGTLTGLDTLPLKETDRLLALHNELTRCGARVESHTHSLTIRSSLHLKQNQLIHTYGDHRMAMAFAPLALLSPIVIQNPSVVSKSYPTFWQDLKKVGFSIEYLNSAKE
ncbi:3-phosphoshikimate 1-carboxyvinyltransferase [Thermaurantimonas aggregans]|uniref:3-phosphoshikimate 1-carboxyvinyltransferase n=1 Tax=Thermaurantimonas aggregans TaxID=2173829 RepID=A0A401XKP2_9FLAO|nr:3-phosphoshikimate 1-carboxyvinyltransferase [Thermaurantimonas aggregans]MCX8147878.1 3-phosphoshikimate 1-carboxyvinyltransferase [Thermaurantimonas aggregans]GCD77541.1 3-phosphoshikimate 1-carboxyvinyltransferase [Thermaurantimonas aggregans]